MIDLSRHPLAQNLDPKLREVLFDLARQAGAEIFAQDARSTVRIQALQARIDALEGQLRAATNDINGKIVRQVNARLGRAKTED